MTPYVDGFLLPVPKDRIEAYRELAAKAGAIWREHGALAYHECVLEAPEAKDMVTFPQLAGARPEETVVLAWATFRSRAHRDEVNAKIMADPRLQEMCNETGMIFDYRRMAFGGFETLVAL